MLLEANRIYHQVLYI